jgi:hypothetical protein
MSAAMLSLEPLFPKFSDVVLNIGVAMGVYALVAVGTDVTQSAAEAATRFPKHAFFAIIASTWMGLQFAVHQTMNVWESWRADAVWRAGLRGVSSGQDAPLNGGVFLWSLLNSTGLGCALRTICGVAVFVLVGCGNGWITSAGGFPWFPPETTLDLLAVCLLSSLYGSAWGIFVACGLSGIDTHVFRRLPKQFLLQLVVPMVLLAHLIFSARFLNSSIGADDYNVFDMACDHWTSFVTRFLPTNELASVTELYKLNTPQSNLSLDACLPIVIATLVLLVACAWPAATALMASKDIREK